MTLEPQIRTILCIFVVCTVACGQVIYETPTFIRVQPENTVVSVGGNATLNCIFNRPVENCYWTKNGDIQNDTFTFTSSTPNTEDCSIIIYGNNQTSGRWRCAVPQTLDHHSILSDKVAVTVGGPVIPKQQNDRTLAANAQLTFLEQPTNTSVKSGDNTILKCVFSGAADHCYWEKDDNQVFVSDRYQFLGDQSNGDCSLSITDAQIKMDDGFWHCGVSQTAAHRGLKSQKSKLTIIMPPKEPKILYNDVEQPKGADIGVSFQSDFQIVCKSELGNPGASLDWTIDGQPIPSGYVTQVTVEQMFQRWTTTSTITISSPVPETWQDKLLQCQAFHLSYAPGEEHTTYVTIRAYKSTTTAVVTCPKCDVIDNETIRVRKDEYADFVCQADGLPIPEYRWQSKSGIIGSWKKLLYNVQNLTVFSTSQQVRCIASNDDFKNFATSNPWTIVGSSSTTTTTSGLLTIVLSLILCLITKLISN